MKKHVWYCDTVYLVDNIQKDRNKTNYINTSLFKWDYRIVFIFFGTSIVNISYLEFIPKEWTS